MMLCPIRKYGAGWAVNSRRVLLAVAAEYAITGYDAQYVALAQSLNAPLITEDRKLRKAVPGIEFLMQEFLAQ